VQGADPQLQVIPPVVERPNEYDAVSLSRRSVILKIHGAVDRLDSERDSYVITEDHYIDFLTHTDIANLVPVALAARLRRSHQIPSEGTAGFIRQGNRVWR
jgi:hypothetical protein